MAVRRTDRARLARLAAPLVFAERAPIQRRRELRSGAAFLKLVRELLLREGIDPESTCVMGQLREDEAALAAIPDTPELREADEAYCARRNTGWIDEEWNRGRRYRRRAPVGEKTFKSEVERLIGRYRADPRIDVTKASLRKLRAWCLSRKNDPMEQAADGSLLACAGQEGAAESGGVGDDEFI